jgi:Fe-S cluster biosynthesis and repair protein YggX
VDVDQRIENFRKMANDDPDNELGHFSLGKALLDAGRHADAVLSFKRVVELKESFSKAYQHLGESLHALGRDADAVSTLKTGFEVAAKRGDLMPRDAMAGLLRELGSEPPAVEVAAPKPTGPVGKDQVHCCRCGIVAPSMAAQPFKGDIGERLLANVCQGCWQEWVAMGIKVINELRLDFSHPEAGKVYDTHMIEFLQLPA